GPGAGGPGRQRDAPPRGSPAAPGTRQPALLPRRPGDAGEGSRPCRDRPGRPQRRGPAHAGTGPPGADALGPRHLPLAAQVAPAQTNRPGLTTGPVFIGPAWGSICPTRRCREAVCCHYTTCLAARRDSNPDLPIPKSDVLPTVSCAEDAGGSRTHFLT